MITGTHAIFYSSDPDATRAFLRDVLDFPFVDVHDGWLIFKLPPAELGVHPVGDVASAGAPISGRHEVFLMCDDVEATVSECERNGVQFLGPIEDQGFGRIVRLNVPGAGDLGLYQPRHATALDLEG